jgi:hypothetical protein
MFSLLEGYETKYYCDMSCLYARNINIDLDQRLPEDMTWYFLLNQKPEDLRTCAASNMVGSWIYLAESAS